MGPPRMNSPMPYDERNEDSGQFTPKFSDEEFIDAVRALDTATTSAVADEVGCKYRTAHSRLSDLRDEGRITSQQVGSSLVWMLSEDDA